MLFWRCTLPVGARQAADRFEHSSADHQWHDSDDRSTFAQRELSAASGGRDHVEALLAPREVLLPALLGAGLSQSMLQAYFNNAETFVIVTPTNLSKDPLLPAATYVMDFHDYQHTDRFHRVELDPHVRQADSVRRREMGVDASGATGAALLL